MIDPRLPEYRYWNQLMDHLDGDIGKLFSGEFVWPRQFEIHLPGDHKRPCDLACPHCLLPNTLIGMQTGEMKSVNDIRIGDVVQGKDRHNRVIAITQHHYKGHAVRINPARFVALTVTENHNVYVFQDEKWRIISANSIKQGDWMAVPVPQQKDDMQMIDVVSLLAGVSFPYKRRRHDKAIWERVHVLKRKGKTSREVSQDVGFAASYIRGKWNRPIGELFGDTYGRNNVVARGKYACLEKNAKSHIPRLIPLNKDFAYLLGFYVAEGTAIISKRRPSSGDLQFSFHKEAKELQSKIQFLVRKIFRKDIVIRPHPSNKAATMVVLKPSLLPFLFGHLCSKKARTKHIPAEIFKASNMIKEAFLQGYIDGDGYRTMRGGKVYIRCTTVSYVLANQLCLLLLTLGKKPTTSVDYRTSRNVIQGRTVNAKPLYEIGWLDISNCKKEDKITKELNGMLAVRIRDTERIPYDGIVYDLTTDGTHSFTAPLLLVANCAGKHFKKDLGTWEMTALELLDKLEGKIPYHIYGGAYTEPLLNPYFMAFLAMTKKHGNHFGIHTNGVLLARLEEQQGWLTELNRISTDRTDYLSISIDAGLPDSWALTKGTTEEELFYEITRGLHYASVAREFACGKGYSIRLCYLISPESGTDPDFSDIVNTAKLANVDSLRFSIPFHPYNVPFDKVREYKNQVEQPGDDLYRKMLAPYLSKSQDERPYIFYTGPEFTDIDRYDFNRCFYGRYQITYGADGYCYRCSTTATPTAKHCRLGKITSDVEEFKTMIKVNQAGNWDCQKECFDKGLRGNRMALEINTKARDMIEESN